MNLPRLAIGTLALVGLLVCPAIALAGPLTLTIANGRVSLSAQDVPLRQILAEWERIGGTRFVNRERVPGSLVTIELSNVSEAKAIETLLRPIAGFLAVARGAETAGASGYASVIIMPGAAAPAMARSGGGASPGGMTQPQADGSGRPQVNRRVLADGRVISFMDNPNRPGEMTIVDDADEPGNDPGVPPAMRPPFGAPGRPGQAPGGMPGGDTDQGDGQSAPLMPPSAMPTMPVRTLPTPGMIPPPVRPGQGPGQTAPPGPIKPPGR